MPDVGISVFEGVANGTTPFSEASKHNIGLLFERERGIPRKPTRVTSLQEDRVRFGGANASMYGPFIARNIFNNAQVYSAVVYGVRILNEDDSETATANLTDGAPTNQGLTVAQIQASGASAPQITHVTPSNVSVGDTFSLTLGTTTLSFVATAPTVASVCAGLLAAINAEITATPAGDWAPVTTRTNAGTHLVLSGANNVSFTITRSTTSGAANTIIIIHAGQEGQQDPGSWGNDLQVRVYPKNHANGVQNAYLWEIYYKGTLVESLSFTTWAKAIEGLNQRSLYITVSQFSSSSLVHEIYDVQVINLTGGVYVAPVEADFYSGGTQLDPLGLNTLDGYDVQLVAVAEHHTTTMAVAGRNYCASRGDCTFIFNATYLANDTTIETYATALQTGDTTGSFCAGYSHWVKTSDENGSFIWVPSIGAVLGSGYIRVPGMQRDHIWIAPGGVESVMVDLVDVSPNPTPKGTVNLWVQRYTMNPIVFQKGRGFFLISSRTMSTNELYHSVHIRRMMNWLKVTLHENLQFALQKPNTPELRRQIIVAVTSFLRPIYNDGGLERSVPFNTAVQIISDKTNNPASQSRKVSNIDVNVIPVECNESLVIRLNRNDGVLIAKELEQAA